jgi:hypothetical protein
MESHRAAGRRRRPPRTSRRVRAVLTVATVLLSFSAALVAPASGATAAAPGGSGSTPAPAISTGAPLVALVTNAPNGPFSSGQYIEVKLGPNSVVKPHSRVYIEECDPPTGGTKSWRRECDRRTRQSDEIRASADGSVDYPNYPIYALPDKTILDESSRHRPRCDLTHACVLFVGQDLEDVGHQVLSLPFNVNPTPGDTGANPGNGVPEAPYVLALPVMALGIFGGSVFIRRRRSAAAHTG